MADYQGVLAENIADLVNRTLPHFLRQGMWESIHTYRHYPLLDVFMPANMIRVRAGKLLDWTYAFGNNGTARHSAIAAPMGQRNIGSYASKGEGSWVRSEAEAIYEAITLSMMDGEEELIDELELQYWAGMSGLGDLMEERGMKTPDDATDKINPTGIPWWIRGVTVNTEDYEGGFNGTYAYFQDGASTANDDLGGNQSRLTNPKLRNWCANHQGFSLHLLEQIKWGLRNMKHKPPKLAAKHSDAGTNMSPKLTIFWPTEYADAYSTMANQRADGRNADVFPFGIFDDLKLGGVDTQELPVLDSDPLQSVYAVNSNFVRVAVLNKWWMKLKKVFELHDPVHVSVAHIDCVYQWYCNNSRLGGAKWHLPYVA